MNLHRLNRNFRWGLGVTVFFLLYQLTVNADDAFPFITSKTPVTLLSTNDGGTDPSWRKTPEGLVDYEIKTPDSFTVIRLFPNRPPVSKTVYGTAPCSIIGTPSMAISADGRFGLITNHDMRLPGSTYPKGTVLRAKSVGELNGKLTPPLTNVLTLIDLASPRFRVVDRFVFPDKPAHVQMMPDKKHFVVGGSENFYVFRIEGNRLVRVRESRHGRGFSCFWIHPTGHGIIATQGNFTSPASINWYKIDDGLNIVHDAEVKPKRGIVAEVTNLTAITRISPDGRLALVCQRAVGGFGRFCGVLVVDLQAKPPTICQVLKEVGDGVESFAFHPNNKMAVVTCLSQHANSIAVLDVESKPVRVLYHLDAGGLAQGIEFTPKGDKLFVGSSFTNRIEIYDVINEFELKKNDKFLKTGYGHSSLTVGRIPRDTARAQQPKHPPAKQTHIRVSKKTTHITTPLDAEGYVDYLAAANLRQARGVTPDNNWEVAARRVLGIGDVPEAMRGEYFRRLGIPVPPAEGDYLLDLVTFAKGAGVAESDERLVEIYSRVTDRPWRTADAPVAARWLRASAKHLDALVEGTRRERNYTPYVLLPSDEEETPVPAMIVLPLPAVQEQRKVARVLTSRALLRIGEGDLKGARSDLLACHRQARLLAQGKITLVHALVGIAIEGMACSADQHLLNSPQLTAAECRAHLGDLAALPPLPNMADHIDVAERHIGLDCVQFLARHEEKNVSELINVIQSLTGGPAPNDGTTYVSLVQDTRPIVDWNATMEVLNEHYDLIADAARGPARNDGTTYVSLVQDTRPIVDWNATMEVLNEHYDLIADAAREPTLAKRDAKLAAVKERLNKLKAGVGAAIAAGAAPEGPKGMGKFVGQILSVLLLPAVPAAIDAHLVSVAKLEATRAAYAIRLHQLSTGKRPESIEAVKPHLGRVPLDPFTEKPLLLKWSGGVFVVYSVGRNRTDDNGDDKEARDGADDIGARGPE